MRRDTDLGTAPGPQRVHMDPTAQRTEPEGPKLAKPVGTGAGEATAFSFCFLPDICSVSRTAVGFLFSFTCFLGKDI